MRGFLRRWSHFAHVRDPIEMRMGSPQYGELILDGEPIADDIEHESLTWSDDRRLLAGQQLVSWRKGPRTRIVIIDAERRVELAVTPDTQGAVRPHSVRGRRVGVPALDHELGERELRLPLPA